MVSESSFRQLFLLYLDLNNLVLPRQDEMLQSIIAQEHARVLTYHPLGYVIYYFDRLVRGAISQEQFLTLGDVGGVMEDQINPHRYREEHPAKLAILTPEIVQDWTEDDLIVLDATILAFYEAQHSKIDRFESLFVL